MQATPTPEAAPVTQEALRPIIAANISELRKSRGMTQQDLAAKLNYTDKAISKWERGESVPDIVVLKQIADMFGVTVDYLLCEIHEPAPIPEEKADDGAAASETAKRQQSIRTRGFVTGMSVLLVWMTATVLFIIFDTAEIDARSHWIVFACAVPASFIVWLILNSVWFNRRRNYLIISLLMWSVLILAFITIYIFSQRFLWLLFLLGFPGQAIVIMWSRLKQSGDSYDS
jgi:transcriptional regulator with XRE-family HTH domain